MPSAESVQIKEFVKSQYAEFNADITLQQMRDGMESAIGALPVLEGAQVNPVTAGGVSAEWVSMPGSATDRVILYLHGGAYTMGSPRTHRDLAARLSQASGARVLVADYRLAPEGPYPAGIEDATAAYGWLLENGITPEHIAIGGDSAGGGLTLATLLSLRDSGKPLPAVAILMSPWTDLTGSGESMATRLEADPIIKPTDITFHVNHYAGSHDPATPLISPVFADLKGLPPMLIHVGNDEVLLDDSVRVAENAQAAGVEVKLKVWEGMWHVFQAYAMAVPEARESIDELGAFVNRHIA